MTIRRGRDFSNTARYYLVQYSTAMQCNTLSCTALCETVRHCTALNVRFLFYGSRVNAKTRLFTKFIKDSFSVSFEVSIFTICDVYNRLIHFCPILFDSMCFKLLSTTLRHSILQFDSIRLFRVFSITWYDMILVTSSHFNIQHNITNTKTIEH
jgi:hypothetical protein